MAATHELHHKIDQLLDALKGTQPFDFLIALDQLCYLFILKMLDEEEESRVRDASPGLSPSKPLFPFQTARYRWRHWCGLPAESLLPFVRDEVFSYMASLIREHAQVSEHFRDAQLMLGGPEKFKQVQSSTGNNILPNGYLSIMPMMAAWGRISLKPWPSWQRQTRPSKLAIVAMKKCYTPFAS